MENVMMKNLKRNTKAVPADCKGKRLDVSIDCGASSMRSINLVNLANPTDKILESPSACGIISTTEDISYIESESTDAFDNLEVKITDISNKKSMEEKLPINPLRLLYGSLAVQAGCAINKPSATLKVDQDLTRYNILTAFALQALAYNNDVEACDKYKATLGLVLPAREAYSSKPENFKTKLCGTYIIELPRLNYKCTIQIDDTDILVKSEGHTGYYYIIASDMKKCKTKEEINTMLANKYSGINLIIDIGASTDNLLIADGIKVNQDQCDTGKVGGNVLLSKIKREIEDDDSLGIRQLTKEEPSLTLGTCQLIRNGEVIDVAKNVYNAKVKTSKEVVADIKNYLATQQLSVQAIQRIFWLGQTCKPSCNLNSKDEQGEPSEIAGIASIASKELGKENKRLGRVNGYGSKYINLLGMADLHANELKKRKLK